MLGMRAIHVIGALVELDVLTYFYRSKVAGFSERSGVKEDLSGVAALRADSTPLRAERNNYPGHRSACHWIVSFLFPYPVADALLTTALLKSDEVGAKSDRRDSVAKQHGPRWRD
jgi:hypothetical protein